MCHDKAVDENEDHHRIKLCGSRVFAGIRGALLQLIQVTAIKSLTNKAPCGKSNGLSGTQLQSRTKPYCVAALEYPVTFFRTPADRAFGPKTRF
jgi:hypothetical protein